jgi:hypothetical protein
MTELAKASSSSYQKSVLSSERAAALNVPKKLFDKYKHLVLGPRRVLDPNADWPTDYR